MKIGKIDFAESWKSLSKSQFIEAYKGFEKDTGVDSGAAYYLLTGKGKEKKEPSQGEE